MDNRKTGGRFAAVVFTCLMVSLVCVIYPLYVIRPFRAQGAQELSVALAVLRWRAVLTAFSALAAVGAAIGYWQTKSGFWRRIGVSLATGLVCILSVLAHVNVYEHMFHPIDHAEFATAAEVKLDPDDKVLAVRLGNVARAYPIRTMGYHHIVNDLLGETAIVATY